MTPWPSAPEAMVNGGAPVAPKRSCASPQCDASVAADLGGIPFCRQHLAQVRRSVLGSSSADAWPDGRLVYYLLFPAEAGTPATIKIGRTAIPMYVAMTRNTEDWRRHRQDPRPTLLVCEPFFLGQDLEAIRHEQFRDLRIPKKKEHFEARDPLTAHVSLLQSQYPDWRTRVGKLPYWTNPDAEVGEEIPTCGAITVNSGLPCRKVAGEGTGHHGVGDCVHHGG